MTIRHTRIDYSELAPVGDTGNLWLEATIFMEDGEIFHKEVEIGRSLAHSRPRDQLMDLVRATVESYAKRLTRVEGKWFLDGWLIDCQ